MVFCGLGIPVGILSGVEHMLSLGGVVGRVWGFGMGSGGCWGGEGVGGWVGEGKEGEKRVEGRLGRVFEGWEGRARSARRKKVERNKEK